MLDYGSSAVLQSKWSYANSLYKPCGYFSLTRISLPVLLRMIAWLTKKLHRFLHRGKPVKCFRVQVLAITFSPIKPYIMWWSLISGLNTPNFFNNSGVLVRMTSISVDEFFVTRVGSGHKPVSSKRRRILLHVNSDLSRKSEPLFERNRAWGYHHQN